MGLDPAFENDLRTWLETLRTEREVDFDQPHTILGLAPGEQLILDANDLETLR